ncbi:MAG: sulfatase-like hydrolase/transferase, partial [Planctomycetes bacterium]|nr:sulfatase-like hydrolase/transferase [Planctomycetota bacterium]
LVIFTSDNGGQSNIGANNGPLSGTKGTMLEGGIKEPMCAVWPGKIKPNTRNQKPVALTMDIFPTLCEVAGVKIDHFIEAKSFLPTLLGKTQSWDDRLLVWVRREGGRFGSNAFYAVRRGNFKLLQNTPFEPLKLYDLKNDPQEKNPLSKKHKMYIQLSKDLRHHIIRSGAVPWEKYPVKL